MNSIWYWLYNAIGVPLFHAGLFLSSLADPKKRLGIAGRKNLFSELEEKTEFLSDKSPRFWIHCSSMGEFEQARPVIAWLKEAFPKGCVVVSFFSPSALEHVKTAEGADLLCYLPYDTRGNARKFYSLIRPNAGIVVRHDIWPNHVLEMHKNGVPVFLINCSSQSQKFFRKPIMHIVLRFMYSGFERILTVSRNSKKEIEDHHLFMGRVENVGDTRYDQVIRRAYAAEEVAAPLRKMKGSRKCFVAGSTWDSDEEVVFDALHRLRQKDHSLWIILVPHEPTPENIARAEQNLASYGLTTARLSSSGDHAQTDVLIVDRIGILAGLYALGDVCFVGGGFGPGVHNVLEPAALGRVVLFGPRHKNSYEAGQLQQCGVGHCVRDAGELLDKLTEFLNDPAAIRTISQSAANLLEENRGATGRILNQIVEIISSR